MTVKEFQNELLGSLTEIKQHWDKKGVHISNDELAQVQMVMTQMSSFSERTSREECVALVNRLQSLIASLSVEVKSEEHELQAETHGGQSFTEDELDRINEYAYRCELVQWLQHALEIVYEVRPEFKLS